MSRLLLFVCFVFPWALHGQMEEKDTRIWLVEENADKLVVAHANGEREDAVRFIWERSSLGGYEMIAISRDGVFPSARLTDVMRTALGGYLDVRIKFSSDGVQPEAEASDLLAEMESMMNILLIETAAADPVFSFSEQTCSALGKLTRIDWSNTRYALEGNGDEEKYIAIYKFVRIQRDALESAIEQDLAEFTDVWLNRDNVVVGNMSDATVCGTVFDEDKYLCALDLQLKEVFVDDPQPGLAFNLLDEVSAEPEFVPEIPEEQVREQVKVRKRDRWLQEELLRLNDRMDKLDNTKEVFAIRDRIDAIEDRLDNIEDELDEVKTKKSTYDNPIVGLGKLTGKNVTIRFRTGSIQVAPEYMVLLNEVFEHMARSPVQRILITGYSDRSGNATTNLLLSEKRANAVRAHLLKRGISAERILVNYYGDTKSSGIDPSERRVEIEWL